MSTVAFLKNGRRQVIAPIVGEGMPVEILGGGASDGAVVDGVSSAIKATVRDYLNANPLAVVLTDTSGDAYIASGGSPATWSKYHAVFAASTNAANIKASAGQIRSVRVFNLAAYPIYVKFHNTAAVPTAGAGVVETVGVQAGTSVIHTLEDGDAFSTGIGITIVKGIADTDATALVLNDGVVDVFFT